MEKETRLSKVLLYQSVGFLVIIALCWVIELTGLHKLVLGNHPYISDFRESTLEMLLILGVWLVVAGFTRRILRRVKHLEGFLRVCAWCRHIHYHGEWIRIEKFLQQGFDTPTTHGICPECLRKEQEAMAKAKERRAAAHATPPDPA